MSLSILYGCVSTVRSARAMSLSWRNDGRSWPHRALLGRQCIKDWLAPPPRVFFWCREQLELDSISAHPFRSAVDSRTRHACQVDIAVAPNFVQLSIQGLTHHLGPSSTMLLTDSSDINTGPFYSTKRCRRWCEDAFPASSRYLRHDA